MVSVVGDGMVVVSVTAGDTVVESGGSMIGEVSVEDGTVGCCQMISHVGCWT